MKKYLLLCLLSAGTLVSHGQQRTEKISVQDESGTVKVRENYEDVVEGDDTDGVDAGNDADGRKDDKDRKNDKRKDKKDVDEAVKGEPRISFDITEHDFGAIPESGKKVSRDYTFTNTGDCPLVITRVITSCKCVSTSFTKKPIPPGGEGVITVTYDPKKQLGVFYKAIQVYSNASEKLCIIVAKGEVKQ